MKGLIEQIGKVLKAILIGRKSLAGQLSIFVGIFLMVAVLLTGGLIYQQAEKVIQALVIGDLERSGSMLNEKMTILINTIDSNTLPKEIEYLMVKESTRLSQKGWEPKQWMITSEGDKVPIQQAQEELPKDVIAQILKNKTGVLKTVSDGEDRTIAYQAIPEKGWYYVLEVLDKGYLAPVYRIRYIAISVAIAVLIASVALVFWMIRKFLRPLSDIQNVMEQVANGDLRVRMEEKNVVREVASVGISLNAMLQKVGSMIRTLDQGIESGKVASHSLSAMVDKNRDQFRMTSDAMQEIGNGAHQQAATVDGTASEMEKMSEQFTKLVYIVQETREVANQMKQSVELGLNETERSATRMQQVSFITEEVDGAVGRLVDGMNQIRKILDTIQGFAEQTNLLALNATIEAARAGEAGRGFAVVAQEVRALADKSRSSADQIMKFTEGIEKEAIIAVKATRNGKQEAEEGVLEVSRSKEVMSKVYQGIGVTQEYISDMAQTIEEWSNKVRTMEQTLSSVREVSRITLTNAEKEQKVTETQLKDAEHLQHSTETLINIMNRLEAESRKFSTT